MKKASIRLPVTPTTKKVWIGSYGGHFDVVVVFNKKPVKAKKGEWNEFQYCTLDNKDIIAGTFACDEFNLWFGTNIKPIKIDIYSVEQYELTAIWSEYDTLCGLHTYVD